LLGGEGGSAEEKDKQLSGFHPLETFVTKVLHGGNTFPAL
jgi:hypothetical protein